MSLRASWSCPRCQRVGAGFSSMSHPLLAVNSMPFPPLILYIGSPNLLVSIRPAPGRTRQCASSSLTAKLLHASPVWKTSTAAPRNVPSASYATWCSIARAAVVTHCVLNAICRYGSRRGPLPVLTAKIPSSKFSTGRTTRKKWQPKS